MAYLYKRTQEVPKDGEILGNRFLVLNQIGKGGFGSVHLAYDKGLKKAIALKVESSRHPKQYLAKEREIYSLLNGLKCFPRMHFFGTDGLWNYLALDLLGDSLENRFNKNNRKFQPLQLASFAYQMINIIEHLHNIGYIHRDLKPHNFMLGCGKNKNKLYLIDFGLAKSYLNPNGTHVENTALAPIVGTREFISLNAHSRRVLSRRDDMESIGYILAYLNTGDLPWTTSRNRMDRVYERKLWTPLHVLFQGLPEEFSIYMIYCLKLLFDQTPEYELYKSLFKKLIRWDRFKYKLLQCNGIL